MGEATYGAGVGAPDVAYLTISTGIGAGVMCGGRLLRGRRSLAEVGHTVIDWQEWRAGRPCTLEELGSGSGMAREAVAAGLGDLDAQTIFDAASRGDYRARDIWDRAVSACAVGVCNLAMTFRRAWWSLEAESGVEVDSSQPSARLLPANPSSTR